MQKEFQYKPHEYEAEQASNSYLMSIVVIMVGMPLPIVNLLATLIFYLGNRKSTYFVRWHCTQAMFSQASLFVTNSVGVWWTIYIIFGSVTLGNEYIAYIICIFVLNVVEFVATIYTAIETRKGKHVYWWFFGELTDKVCKS